jgi:hypothetical protein
MKNRAIERDPVHQQITFKQGYKLGEWTDTYTTEDAANAAAQGHYIDIPLEKGDYVIIVIPAPLDQCITNSKGIYLNIYRK